MKKLLCLLLIGIMAVSVTACFPSEPLPWDYDDYIYEEDDIFEEENVVDEEEEILEDELPEETGYTGTNNGIAGTKLKAFQDYLEDGEFYISMLMNDSEGSDFYFEMYVKNDNTLTYIVMSMFGREIDLIIMVHDGVIYMILEEYEIYIITDYYNVGMEIIEETFGADIDFVRSGTDNFNGVEFFYEEFLALDGEIMQFFFDGDIIVGIRMIMDFFGEEYITDMLVLDFGTSVPDGLIQIPDGYELVDEDTLFMAMMGM